MINSPTRRPEPSLRALKTPVLLGLTIISLLLAACRPPEPSTVGNDGVVTSETANGLRLRMEFSSLQLGSSTVTIHVLDGSQGVADAEVEVRADMSHAGMQPVIADAEAVAPGEYRVSDFAFSMAGDWIVTATVKTADGREARLETFVNVSSR